MVSCDTRISGSSGNASASQPEICCGDQYSASLASTAVRNRAHVASFAGFGRRIRRSAARSAGNAR